MIIDNTPLPEGGAFSDETLIAMLAIQTEFEMTYNVKSLTVYCGLACLLVLFIIIGLIYLQCKLRNLTNTKRARLFEESAGRYGVEGGSKVEKDE